MPRLKKTEPDGNPPKRPGRKSPANPKRKASARLKPPAKRPGKAARPSGAARPDGATRHGKAAVDWVDVGLVPVPKPKALAALSAHVLRSEGLNGRVNLVFCENSLIRRLNRQFRKLDKVTDVLSFHYGEDEADPDGAWGEIYIATTQAQMQAPRWKNSFFDELRRLVVHGSLHLAGYDHMQSKERLTMRTREDHYLTHGK